MFAQFVIILFFFFSSRRRHTRYWRDWSSDVCSSDLGDPVAALSQVHGSDVAYVGPEGPRSDLHGHLHARADGVVTDQAGVTLMVRGADCAMVLLADAERGVIGGCHCGRLGLVAGVV